MSFLKTFIEDIKYYDLENKELNAVIKYTKPKGKTILDIGSGNGRLAIPLSKYGKVTALDSDKRFKNLYKNTKVLFVNKKAEHYLKKSEKFDIIILAWPVFNLKFLNIIKKVMHKYSVFIFITCDDYSDYELIVDKLEVFDKKHFNKDMNNKWKFIKFLPKKFKLMHKKKINTNYIYPNEKEAFRIISNSTKLWYNLNLNKEQKEKLKDLIKDHKFNNKVKFNEEIHFLVLKLKRK